MCKILEEVLEEGMKKGKQETMLDTAKRMLKDGKLSLEMIAEYSGLSLDEVLKLQKA